MLQLKPTVYVHKKSFRIHFCCSSVIFKQLESSSSASKRHLWTSNSPIVPSVIYWDIMIPLSILLLGPPITPKNKDLLSHFVLIAILRPFHNFRRDLALPDDIDSWHKSTAYLLLVSRPCFSLPFLITPTLTSATLVALFLLQSRLSSR
jgi:hypothetical protein